MCDTFILSPYLLLFIHLHYPIPHLETTVQYPHTLKATCCPPRRAAKTSERGILYMRIPISQTLYTAYHHIRDPVYGGRPYGLVLIWIRRMPYTRIYHIYGLLNTHLPYFVNLHCSTHSCIYNVKLFNSSRQSAFLRAGEGPGSRSTPSDVVVGKGAAIFELLASSIGVHHHSPLLVLNFHLDIVDGIQRSTSTVMVLPVDVVVRK